MNNFFRKPGVYWTRTIGNSWHDLSYWDGFEWQVPDEDQKLNDCDLDDIGEEDVEECWDMLEEEYQDFIERSYYADRDTRSRNVSRKVIRSY